MVGVLGTPDCPPFVIFSRPRGSIPRRYLIAPIPDKYSYARLLGYRNTPGPPSTCVLVIAPTIQCKAHARASVTHARTVRSWEREYMHMYMNSDLLYCRLSTYRLSNIGKRTIICMEDAHTLYMDSLALDSKTYQLVMCETT